MLDESMEVRRGLDIEKRSSRWIILLIMVSVCFYLGLFFLNRAFAPAGTVAQESPLTRTMAS
jgi:hypothetical protein